jgi:hypothetical protein
MATIWLTYAWDDNKYGDVDFIAQELSQLGLKVKLDRWNIQAGKPLWAQIENFIQNPLESDAWAIYATPHSLGSKPCMEEFNYALDRALSTRGSEFPILAISPGSVDHRLLPAGIRTRLYVGTADPDWKERIVATAENRAPSINRQAIKPYHLKTYIIDTPNNARRYIIEVRPRAGHWSPFVAAIPTSEKNQINLGMLPAPSGHLPSGGSMVDLGEETTADGLWWARIAQDQATPTQSYFLFCDVLPSKLMFGVFGSPGVPLYQVSQTELLK